MDDSGASACIIIVFFILLVIEAILQGFRSAIPLVNEKEIERKALEDKDRRSVLLYEIIERSTIHFNSVQMIITLVELTFGYFYLPIWVKFFENLISKTGIQEKLDIVHGLALFCAVFSIMYVILTLGILLPKKLARKFPDKWAYIFIGSVSFLKKVLYPLTGLVAISANLVLTVLGLRDHSETVDVTEEEIISMVNEGHEQGVLEASEAEMITNIFEYGEKEASDIMTHRSSIIAIDSEMPFKDALNLMLRESNSRYPVYEENLDHIVGVLYLKDAMRLHTSDESLNKPVCKIKGLMREAVVVPETKNIDDLFKTMQSEKNQMVIVMDEYGQTAGLVTMEDILEEIVGNIMDEYDDDENHIEDKGNNEYVIEGLTRLEDLEESFDIDFGESEFETLNGYLISKLDRIPDEEEHTEIIADGYSFKIMKVEKNVIQSVLVTKLQEDKIEEIAE